MNRPSLSIVRSVPVPPRSIDDLVLVLALALLAALAALVGAPIQARLPLGLLAVLFLPGYAATLALFPRGDDLSRVERATLAAGASIAITTAVAVALDRTPWVLRPTPIILAVATSTCVGVALAWLRRRRIEPEARNVLVRTFPTLRRPSGRSIVALAAGTGLLVLLVVGIARHTAAAAQMTEFYALGPEGMALDYPRVARSGETISLGLGIVNREGEAETYQIMVQGEAGPLAPPRSINVADGTTWEGQVTFTLPGDTVDQEVQVVLEKPGTSGPYRQLRLWVDGVPAGGPRR